MMHDGDEIRYCRDGYTVRLRTAWNNGTAVLSTGQGSGRQEPGRGGRGAVGTLIHIRREDLDHLS